MSYDASEIKSPGSIYHCERLERGHGFKAIKEIVVNCRVVAEVELNRLNETFGPGNKGFELIVPCHLILPPIVPILGVGVVPTCRCGYI